VGQLHLWCASRALSDNVTSHCIDYNVGCMLISHYFACAAVTDLACVDITCTASDDCHVEGACSGGECSNPAADDGTSCDDGDVTTTGDMCTAGFCAGIAHCLTESDCRDAAEDAGLATGNVSCHRLAQIVGQLLLGVFHLYTFHPVYYIR
jgi:hypothetical protein